jgi:superfamily II DNA or RNA helicase
MNNGYIYIRTHEYYNNDNICKLGKTKNIYNRDFTYATSEYKRGEFILIIEILNDQIYDDTFVEKLLQKYFKNYHSKSNGGNEFYNNKIINEIVLFLLTTKIKFKVLSNEEINNLIKTEHIKILSKLLEKLIIKIKENNLRYRLQNLYITDIISNLYKYNKVFIKAPTGFGKTHLYYKTIIQMKFNKILFLTPRILLNHQIVEDKYSFYIKNDNYKIIHFSDLTYENKENTIKNLLLYNKIIITSCYQSGNKLLDYIKKYNIKFNLIIFDESHIITTWTNENNNISDFLYNNDICDYRLYGSATPTEEIELNQSIYGNIIEKVKVYELINYKLLCNIETIVKQINNKKSEYHNLTDLIVESMIKYNKKKGIVYVNECINAENLYRLLQKQNKINIYIYISKNIITENINDTNIKIFENDTKQCIIISVGKIGYGYDNELIDFICLGDPRQSDIDIRQILGRGLRWNKKTYPNKLLHLLVPLYKDEFNNYQKNEHLKKYLDYIIGECGQDIIIKNDGSAYISNNNNKIKNGNNYNGENIPTEILNEYCTTGYNKYSNFIKFLKNNNIYDELTYNKLKETQTWIISLSDIHKKYPKFCFRHIHPNNINYYWNKKEALDAIIIIKDILIKNIGKDNYYELSYDQLIKKYNLLNNKIPNIDLDLYYPID